MSYNDTAVDATLPAEFVADWFVLETATDEHPLMNASIELLKEAESVCLLASGIMPEAPLQRDDAVRCGLLVRLGKLCRLMLADTGEAGGGQELALSGQISTRQEP